ncbi:RagB/SusD family nutrient uptake outer membrane protein [Flavihumibacter sp. CACIAM 22H1]|uniref:RagB/SusD family nutrient uptake outer membrane protein n=1 Tax=Flavihumibacter sp. CACIAM 22H1 TaxID=1812911 RepID=UPI0007A932D5|nr:RagB/SusD family nutrient uptake outer membrane protein [Flavihumibacter sp. CACIAM 22H1]KYP15837.1 MAG: RagB/SusD family protein [Flavihumibacter sp. CACIAM 22H1]
MKQYIFKSVLLATLITGMAGCSKNFDNPGATPVDNALTTSTGLTGVAVGVQKQYSVGRQSALYNLVTANGFTTFELSLRNEGNVDEFNLSKGGINVDGNNGILGNLWTNSLKVIFDANNVLNNAPNLGDKNYASGLIGYASIFKALALGNLAMFWEQVPASIGTNVSFVARTEGFAQAIATIDAALAAIAANPISNQFLANIPTGIEIPNTLQALKARYSLFSGNYPAALAAANAVTLTSKSTMNFDAISPNPIFNVSTATNNVFQVIDSTFGLPEALRPDMSDGRVGFYMSLNTTIAPRWRIKGFGADLASPWPIYVPGEMTLIKAEAHARAGAASLPDAIVELNKVLTKTSAADPFGIGANQGPYGGAVTQEAVLTEIYRQRALELYMQGFKLEDMRRFNRSNEPNVEKKRNFFPYPFRERDNNPNTPVDPNF